VLPDVIGEEAANVETGSAADQQVQHLGHFLFISVIYFFLSQLFFTLPLHQVLGSTTGDTASDMGEVVVEAKKYPAANQLVQHLCHFLLTSVISCDFYLSHFFIMFLPQFFGHGASDSATQFSVPGDSFTSVINDVIRGLEDDSTQKELHAKTSRVEERHPVVLQENVTTAITK
jgi:hypothetical protein